MRKKRVEKLILDQECTFKPNLVSSQPPDTIDPSTQRLQTELTGNATIQEVDEDRYGPQKDVFERMAMSVTEANAKKKGLVEKIRQEEDVSNKFRPKTGKAPKQRRQQVDQTGGIGNYLYTKGKL